MLTVPLLYSGRHDPTGNAYGTAVFYVGRPGDGAERVRKEDATRGVAVEVGGCRGSIGSWIQETRGRVLDGPIARGCQTLSRHEGEYVKAGRWAEGCGETVKVTRR